MCLRSTPTNPAKTDEPIQMSFEKQTYVSPGKHDLVGVRTLAPRGNGDGMICAVVAMRTVATISIAICLSY